MEISALDNEELLRLFTYLTARDLLQCRAVCHRWALLAQDPTLWRRQHLVSANYDPKLLTTILRFAPCLGHVVVSSKRTEPGNPLWSTLLSTACSTSGLVFIISSADAGYAALIIARHASLGRLKTVIIEVLDTPDKWKSVGWKHSLCGLLMQVSHTQGFGNLTFIGNDIFMNDAVAEFAKQVGRAPATAPVSPSLQYLKMSSFDFFGQLLMQWHADTLEGVRALAPSPNSAQAALLLSRMPRLHDLVCTPLDNMHALLQCPSLKGLVLHVHPTQDSDDARRLLKACAYLRVAVSTQLHDFGLTPWSGGAPSVEKLLLCLEGKEGTVVTLRSLRLDFTMHNLRRKVVYARYQEPLTVVLHRLSVLTLLDLDSMPVPALLQALDGRAVPELTQLLVRLPGGEYFSSVCGHQFIHSEAVRTLLRNYLRLHVIIKEFKPSICGCAFCKEKCHAVPHKAWCMLSSHEAGARCDVPHGRYYCYDEENKECVVFRIKAD